MDVDYDIFAPATIQEPAFYHRLLREQCPVHRYEQWEHPLFTLSRYEDVRQELRDHHTWSARFTQGPSYVEEPGLRTDPPEHTIFRRLLGPIFHPTRIAALEDRIAELAHDRIDSFIDAGEAELFAQYASPVPIYVIADLMGVERERADDFRTWVDDFVEGSNTANLDLAASARARVHEYFAGKIHERRQQLRRSGEPGPDDVVNVFAAAEHPEGRPFTDDEVSTLTMLVLAGGVDTSTFLVTNVVFRLLERRELWTAVVADHRSVEVAIEESLRFDPPVLGIFRTNNEPMCLHGVEIPSRSKVQALIGSANRDGTVWVDPDSFRLDRDLEELRRTHLTFGAGVHLCIGAPLARLEGRVMLQALIERIPSLRLRGRHVQDPTFMMHGFRELPVVWDPSAAPG